jgi:hypothetical protein
MPEGDPEPQAVQSTRGHGGKGVVEGDGVIAGGGGRGATLFSGPQPQSTGSTPHGRRAVDGSPGQRTGSSRKQGSTSRGSESVRVPHTGALSPARGRRVEGTLVAARGSEAKVAPGLFAADRGGDPGATAGTALALAVVAAGAFGWRRERRLRCL